MAVVQVGVAMQCLTPSSAANACSNLPTESQLSPESNTSWTYFRLLGPMVRGKRGGTMPALLWAAAPRLVGL